MAVTAGNGTWAVRIEDGQVAVNLRPANRALAGFTTAQAWELVRALAAALDQDAHASEAAGLRREILRLEDELRSARTDLGGR